MTTLSLLARIRAVLGGVAPSLTNASDASDLYEAYVFSLVIEAARREGVGVEFLDVQGRPASLFVFRTSPGHIGSRRQNYCYARLNFSQKPALEVHVSVRATGCSGVPHECDILVLDEAEASLCRSAGSVAIPRRKSVKMAVECKFYSSHLKLSLAREFCGFGAEFGKGSFFVTNSSSASVQKLLTRHKREWEREVYPGGGRGDEMRSAFQRVFKHYIAS